MARPALCVECARRSGSGAPPAFCGGSRAHLVACLVVASWLHISHLVSQHAHHRWSQRRDPRRQWRHFGRWQLPQARPERWRHRPWKRGARHGNRRRSHRRCGPQDWPTHAPAAHGGRAHPPVRRLRPRAAARRCRRRVAPRCAYRRRCQHERATHSSLWTHFSGGTRAE